RHLRWWIDQPIVDDSGSLTLGYRYENQNLCEVYNSPAAPYWSFKSFLPLALPESDPFWSSNEEQLPSLPPLVAQRPPRLLICRDHPSDHVVAFGAGKWAEWKPRHVAEKYSKFCYSNCFGFSVPIAQTGLAEGAHDSMLALSEEGLYFRVRRRSLSIDVS